MKKNIPPKKESESTPILSDSKQSKIDLNQFINLTHDKDMRKISLKGHLCPKSLAFKQILLTMKITIFLLLFITFQTYYGNSYLQCVKINI